MTSVFLFYFFVPKFFPCPVYMPLSEFVSVPSYILVEYWSSVMIRGVSNGGSGNDEILVEKCYL